MPRETRPDFSTSRVFTARRAFTLNGKKYAAGDVFSWRRVCCAPRKLRQLWEQRLIECSSEEVPPSQAARDTLAGETHLREEALAATAIALMFDPETDEVKYSPSKGWLAYVSGEDAVKVSKAVSNLLKSTGVPVEFFANEV